MTNEITNWDKKGIWARINCSQNGGTGEWDSECLIFHGERIIGSITEWGDRITLQGEFDYIEDGKDEEGLPNIMDYSLKLSLIDLMKLQIILTSWNEEDEDSSIWIKEEDYVQ